MTNELGVYINDNRIVVSSRDVARVFEKEHFNVLQSIRNLECSKSFTALNFQVSTYKDKTGRELTEYLITRDGFTLLAQFKEKYIATFNKMEKELELRQNGYALPSNYLEALEALVQTEKLRQALAAKVEEDKPKVLFANAVETAKTDILIGDFAKILKQNGIDIGQKRLFAKLRENGWLIKQKGESWNMPTQVAMDRGLFRVKETTFCNPDGSVRITKTTKITGNCT